LTLGGQWADRWGRKRPAVIGSAVVAITMASLGFTASPFEVLAICALSGAGTGMLTPPVNAAVADVLAGGSGARGGPALAGFQVVGDVGAILGPVLAGLVVTLGGYATAFTLTAMLAGASIWSWRRAPDGTRRSHAAEGVAAEMSPSGVIEAICSPIGVACDQAADSTLLRPWDTPHLDSRIRLVPYPVLIDNAEHDLGDHALNEVGDGIGHEAMNQAAASATKSKPERWTQVKIEILGQDDWQDLRSARLAALRESPDAFVATLADELARTPEDWKLSIEQSVWAGAWENGHIVGIACLSAADPDAPKQPSIESVWVTPQHRRQGIVRDMLAKLESPARADGATHLQLWVLETNYAAFDAYLKLDFQEVPESSHDSEKARGDGTIVQERLMVKQLW
jgi:ribosomal protein S18 acetylase RimI-like enzyme